MSHQHWITLHKYSLSPNQEYLLDCYREKIVPSKVLINEAVERQAVIDKGFLTTEGVLTPKAILVLDACDLFKVKAKKKVTTTVLGDDFLEKIKYYRELFPAIKLGSNQLARQSVKELQDKFVWFFKTYPQFEWDLVLRATDIYTLEYQSKQWQYMQTSSYFIQKTDNMTKAVRSTLADYCQLLLDDPNYAEKFR